VKKIKIKSSIKLSTLMKERVSEEEEEEEEEEEKKCAVLPRAVSVVI